MTRDDWAARGRSWWSHVGVLADDSMEGRATGSAGYRRAAEYVADQFQRAGLEPAGTDGFLQPVDFRVAQLEEAKSSLSLVRDGTPEPLRLREDAQFAVSSETASDLEAEAVFVGYGLEVPEHRYSDLAGMDLRGKIAVYFRGGPAELPGPVKAHYQSVTQRLRSLRKAGAVGSILLINPTIPDLPWPRLATGLLLPRMELADRPPGAPRALPIALLYNPDRLDRLLAGSGHTTAEILDGLRGRGPLPRFPLAVTVRAHAEVRQSTARCSNVVGVVRGSDPALRHEYVVGSAHLDHLGVGEPIRGDPIYAGAMDNASGVASLIEIARAMQRAGTRPKRSVVFLAVTGEEKGLLGSEHFATHPTVSGAIVADLNMDMFLPLFPMRSLEVQGVTESSLGPLLRDLAQRRGVEVHPDHEPDRVLFIRSDQYNFVKVGVPSLMLSLGYEKGSKEEEIAQSFFRDRYHSPADDTEQPVDREAAAQFTDLLRELMEQVANHADRPAWNPDSFFRNLSG